MKRSAHAIPLLCMIWAACSLTTGPELSGDTYALADVGGSLLPVRVGDETWVADTIRFDPQGGWSRVEVVVLHSEGSEANPIRREGTGFIGRNGSRIVLDFRCPPNALQLCVAPDTLRLVDDTLVRRANRYGAVPLEDPAFRYEPVQ